MTKIIAAAIIIVVLYCGWELFVYWDKVKNERETAQKQAAAAALVIPEQLSGMPNQLEPTLQAAKNQGAAGLRNWLKAYGPNIQDPRKAWIELDFCIAIARENPAEAKLIFAAVKERTPASSPVWPRIKQLEKSYE